MEVLSLPIWLFYSEDPILITSTIEYLDVRSVAYKYLKDTWDDYVAGALGYGQETTGSVLYALRQKVELFRKRVGRSRTKPALDEMRAALGTAL